MAIKIAEFTKSGGLLRFVVVADDVYKLDKRDFLISVPLPLSSEEADLYKMLNPLFDIHALCKVSDEQIVWEKAMEILASGDSAAVVNVSVDRDGIFIVQQWF